MKYDGKDIEGGRCTKGKDERLNFNEKYWKRRFGFSEKNRKRIWKNHMEEIMNKENDWDHMTK